jgi:hypothetical protein
MTTVTLDQALDVINQLPIEQQEMLIDIIRSRHLEERRRRIAQDAHESLQMYLSGQLKPQLARQVIRELRQTLKESDETEDYLVKRAGRGSKEKFHAAMAKVAKEEPSDERDRIQ